MKVEWEQKWRYHGIPSIGDYIQVKWVSKDDTEAGLSEGIVMRIDDRGMLYLSDGDVRTDLVAQCWRKGFLPMSRKAEVVREEAL